MKKSSDGGMLRSYPLFRTADCAVRVRPHAAGFTLIQLSVLLAVAGMVLAATLPGSDAGNTNEKILQTLETMDKIEASLNAFMAKNGYRPCPADGQYDINDEYFGREAGYASPNAVVGTCTGGIPAAPMGPDNATGHIYMGTVPTKTLDIPDQYAFDAWGRQISYLVDGRTTDNALCYNMVDTKTMGDITITWKSYTGVTLNSEESMYALISHGADGHGAWPPQGSSVAGRINRNNTDADTMTNAGVNAAFTYSTAIFTNVKIKGETNPNFDDLVYYRPNSRSICCIGDSCQLFNPKAFKIEGETTNDAAGTFCGTFDVNADGFDDLVVTSPNAAAGGMPNAGRVYVKFGTTTPITEGLALGTLDGTNGFVIWGGASGNRLGVQVDTGDFNGDGIDDLAMMAPGAQGNRGEIAIMFGASGAYPASMTTSAFAGSAAPIGQKGIIIVGAATDTAERIVTNKFGDFNGDRIDDLMIGDPNANSEDGDVFLVYGSTTLTTPINLSVTSPPTDTAVIEGASGTANRFGHSGARCDVNADGIDDIVIGAPHHQVGTFTNAGEVNVIFGKSSKFTSTVTYTTLVDGTQGYRNHGVYTDDDAGRTLGCGDINGDGLEDLTMAAPGSDTNSGAVFVEYGRESGFTATKSLNSLLAATTGYKLQGKANSRAGESIKVADVNGDGVDDVMIGAPDMDVGVKSKAGGAYVSFGTRWGYLSVNDLESRSDGNHGMKIEGHIANERAGLSVCATNLNGTRVRGVVLGAPEATTASGLSNAGKVYTIRGRRKWNAKYPLNAIP